MLEIIGPIALIPLFGPLFDQSDVVVLLILYLFNIVEALFVALSKVHTLKVHHLVKIVVCLLVELDSLFPELDSCHVLTHGLISLLSLLSHQILRIVLVEISQVEILQALTVFVDVSGVNRATIIYLTLIIVQSLPRRLDRLDQVPHQLKTFLLILAINIRLCRW